MPCDTIPRQAAKQKIREKQVKTLEKELKEKKAKLVKTPQGIRVEGWTEQMQFKQGGRAEGRMIPVMPPPTDAN